MNTAALYQSPARWPVVVALAAAVTIETAAVGLATLRRQDNIPIVAGLLPRPLIELEFIPIPPETAPPENVPPPLPPAPDLPPEFTVVEPVLPPRPVHQPPPLVFPHIAHPAPAAAASLATARTRLASAPPPPYPYEARRAHATGSGMFLLHFDGEGAVTEVKVARSTGSAVLDQISLSTFRRWHCERGAYHVVKVPVTFTLAGAQL